MFSFVRQAFLMEKSGIVYECTRCGARVPAEELELRGGETKCIICGYRILKKVKPPVVKRVQSR
jgi:DNA-directed RNA polymerase subunit RPC12/RpoP